MADSAVGQQDDLFGSDDVLTLDVAAEAEAGLNPARANDRAAADERSILVNPHATAPAHTNEHDGDHAHVQDHGAQSQSFCRCVGEVDGASTNRIRQALRGQLKSNGLEFADTPLEEVVAFLQEEYGIPVKLDVGALDEMGLGAEEPVHVNLRNISLASALRLMLKGLDLTYIIQDEVLLITTPDEAEQQLHVCVYDVRDLRELTKVDDIKTLVDTIVSCVASETWAKNGGGEAEIRTLGPGLLVVSQTQAVHDEVRKLLETIRATAAAPTEAAAATAPPMHPAAPAAGQLVTRSYYLQLHQPDDAGRLREEVRRLITSALPDEQWAGRLDDGQAVVLSVLPDRVVLRHRESVHDAVETLLSESGIATPAQIAGAEMSGFGGRGGGRGGGGGGFFSPASGEDQ
jgi:hypothetical protein